MPAHTEVTRAVYADVPVSARSATITPAVDTRQFIASLVNSLAWPAAVVVLLFVFRQRITELFEQLPKRLKAGPLEVEWDRAVAVTATGLVAPRQERVALTPTEDLADLAPLTEAAPRAAVLDAASRVEAALRARFESSDVEVPPSPGLRNLARRARDAGLVEVETARSIEGLGVMRDLAAHTRDEVTPERAREFLTLADAVIYQLDA
jgi:hypothetical protein